MKDFDRLTRKNREIVEALISTRTIKAASQKAGISEASIYRRLRDPEFKKHLHEARKRAWEGAMGYLQAQAQAAAGILVDLMTGGGTETTRLSAAKEILATGARWQELADFAERLSAIEETLEARRQ